MGLEQGITRREFLELLAKGTAGLALSGALIGCGRETGLLPTPTVARSEKDFPKGNLSLDQVKSGIVTPQEYLQEKERYLPEVVEAKSSGMLKGFLYEPSGEDLERVLRELFSGRINDEQTLQYLVGSSIDNYRITTRGKKEVATIIPGIIGVFGQEVPMYVAFQKELFSSPEVNNDADLRSVVSHELQHVEDQYKGITLKDISLSYNTISPETFRIDFLSQLMELRAVYRELENIFRERVKTGVVSVSSQWLASQASNYSDHWKFLKGYSTTDLERKTKELQFAQFRGIVPEIRKNEILIKFDLFGTQDTIIMKQAR